MKAIILCLALINVIVANPIEELTKWYVLTQQGNLILEKQLKNFTIQMKLYPKNMMAYREMIFCNKQHNNLLLNSTYIDGVKE